jgi:hypothetical protein
MIHVRDVKRPEVRFARGHAQVSPDVNWAAAGWAGIVAGAAFLLIQTTLTTLTNGSGDVVRQIAGIALGQSVLPGSTPFTALVFVMAVAVHLPLSLVYARLLAVIVDGMPVGRAAEAGALFGVCLYVVNYYGFAYFFPWFALARGWVALSSHVAFGALAAAVYVELAQRRRVAVRHA